MRARLGRREPRAGAHPTHPLLLVLPAMRLCACQEVSVTEKEARAELLSLAMPTAADEAMKQIESLRCSRDPVATRSQSAKPCAAVAVVVAAVLKDFVRAAQQRHAAAEAQHLQWKTEKMWRYLV